MGGWLIYVIMCIWCENQVLYECMINSRVGGESEFWNCIQIIAGSEGIWRFWGVKAGSGQILQGLLSTPQGCSTSVELALACSWISGSERERPGSSLVYQDRRHIRSALWSYLNTFGLVSYSPIYEKVHLCASDLRYPLDHILSPMSKDFPVAQTVKNLLLLQETRVPSLGWEDPLKKRMAIHSSILAWRIPWTEKPGRLHGVAKSWTRLSD